MTFTWEGVFLFYVLTDPDLIQSDVSFGRLSGTLLCEIAFKSYFELNTYWKFDAGQVQTRTVSRIMELSNTLSKLVMSSSMLSPTPALHIYVTRIRLRRLRLSFHICLPCLQCTLNSKSHSVLVTFLILNKTNFTFWTYSI